MKRIVDDGMGHVSPRAGDIVIRCERQDDDSIAFYLRTLPGPDQYSVPTRDKALAAALIVAERYHVSIWMADDDGGFTLLNDFRREPHGTAIQPRSPLHQRGVE